MRYRPTRPLAIATLAAALLTVGCSGPGYSDLTDPSSARAPSPSLFAAAEVEAASARPTLPATTWSLHKGDSLRIQLAAWAERDGWRLSWEVPHDYPVRFDADFSARTVVDAVAHVVESLRTSRAPVRYLAMEGNKVLRIVEW